MGRAWSLEYFKSQKQAYSIFLDYRFFGREFQPQGQVFFVSAADMFKWSDIQESGDVAYLSTTQKSRLGRWTFAAFSLTS
jgi:hypothetical protein